MENKILIPEERLQEMVDIIRSGIEHKYGKPYSNFQWYLLEWCEEIEEYLKGLEKDGE